jgi:SOS-response transcriptional repressor LexA
MIDTPLETLGPKIRKQRRRLGLTLDELAVRTQISKPYLSLIENDRIPNPPSDEKLRRLEQTLGFTPGQLVSQAHLQRTPHDVRAMLAKLVKAKDEGGRMKDEVAGASSGASSFSLPPSSLPSNLDAAYMSGILQELVDRSAGNVERLKTNAVPIINRVAAGYPTDFTDLSYPKGVADDYLACPDVSDKDAFAARVHGDSMTPKYRQGDIVIFSPAAIPRNGDDCFVRFMDGKTTFKRVFFEKGDKGEAVIRLQPRNERYRAQIVDAESINGVWRAVFRYQSVDEE